MTITSFDELPKYKSPKRILGFLVVQHWDDGFWFRVFGYGLVFSKLALFSDRHFKRKKYFGYYIRPIGRNKINRK